MKISLVGYTGFVGTNLINSFSFDEVYNTQNISESFGSNPDLLVYAGIRSEKYIANKFPNKDLEDIYNAMENIKKINPKKIVLISTIDVYDINESADENSFIESSNLLPYGRNRFILENWVKENYNDFVIVRLPGLYGLNIKKNFIFDMINNVPKVLTENKFNDLCIQSPILLNFYEKQDNGFYKLKTINSNEHLILRKVYKNLSFSSLNFTDSRGVFQFYNLFYLWDHINVCLLNGIKVVNLVTEPLNVAEIYNYIFEKEFVNEIQEKPPYYNLTTKYAQLFGGTKNYIFDKKFVLEDIKQYVEKQNEIINF
ncbi:MAG: hypothetical protein RSA87_03675 [Malacoplasma sp.]